MNRDMTTGGELRAILLFSIPLILGNLLQQLYNVVDTLIVGRALGPYALAAVGSSFSLMVFLTSANLGLCMGSGAVFSQLYGARDWEGLRSAIYNAFLLVGTVTLAICLGSYLALDPMLRLLQVQPEVLDQARIYLGIVLWGMPLSFLFNFFANLLRSVGNSLTPLLFLGAASLLNVGLDLLFVLPLEMGIAGAALATVIAQGVSGLLAAAYFWTREPGLRPRRENRRADPALLRRIGGNSLLTALQQSIMNFGILMIQGLVNSFGVAAMAAFAAAVKIDSFAYMPLQDFGNAFSTYTAQNFGAGKGERIRRGTRAACALALSFGLGVSLLVMLLAPRLMLLFVGPEEQEILGIGTGYLRIEGAFYPLIAGLFLLYGYYRGLGRPGVSALLTVISLGSRVLLSYTLAPIPSVGLVGIWFSIPIGWLLADVVGVGYALVKKPGRISS